ncbi:MAG: uracil-DNA glycosylase [Saprospiraceae bacterium]|nr:uracil-DNA glycosylase [Saprospiraceae bacterium]
MEAIDHLIEELAKLSGKHNSCFNPFADHCPTHDLPEAITIRKANLRRYLLAQHQLQADSLWVGEAPGYNGVRRSGMYLVSEPQFEELGRRLGGIQFQKATRTPDQATRSSKAVWKLIQTLAAVPLTYDAFPLHAFRNNPPFVNRSPSRSELQDTAHILERLLEIFQPQRIIAIGRKAEYALDYLGVKSIYVRHPSRGGGPAFEQGIKGIYGLEDAWPLE